MEWFHKETLFYKWWLPLAATDTRMWKYKNSIRLETSGSDKDKQTTGIRSLARLTAVGTHSSSLRHIVSVCHVIKIIRRAFLWENLGLSGNYVLERPLDWFAFWGVHTTDTHSDFRSVSVSESSPSVETTLWWPTWLPTWRHGVRQNLS